MGDERKPEVKKQEQGNSVLEQYHSIASPKERVEFYVKHRDELAKFISGLNHPGNEGLKHGN
jgi:hypothetical protein